MSIKGVCVMSGYVRVYCIANEVSEDGRSFRSMDLQILLGASDREWYEAYYFDKSITPIGKIKVMVPLGPDDENSLLDACIAFAPKYFETCLSLEKIKLEFKDKKYLDFPFDKDIPESWNQLRREARPIFEKLNIFEIKLIPLTTDQKYSHSNYKEWQIGKNR
jgi:hypothetical protein